MYRKYVRIPTYIIIGFKLYCEYLCIPMSIRIGFCCCRPALISLLDKEGFVGYSYMDNNPNLLPRTSHNHLELHAFCESVEASTDQHHPHSDYIPLPRMTPSQ